MAIPLALPLPAVPAVAPLAPDAPLVEPAPVLLVAPVLLPGADEPVDEAELEPDPIRALVSMNCELPMRELPAVEPAVPLVPVAPVVPLVPPPLRHPVTVIARLPVEV